MNPDLHVLVVDDQEPSRVLSKFALMELGFKNVHEATNGHEAMEYVAKAYQAGTPVERILSDHDMPEVDGFQFYRVLRETEICRDIPFMMVTSHSEPDLVAQMALKGIQNFIIKPIDPKILGEKIVKMVMRG